MCIHSLIFRPRPNKSPRYILLAAVILLFIFGTLDVMLQLVHVLDAFIWYKGSGGALGEFSNISYWVNAMKSVTYAAQVTIADAILV